jgi:hypothetical protein
MKLERNRAERRSKHGAQILFNGIPYLILAALAAGFLHGAPQMIAASSIAQAAKSTVTVTERKAFPIAFAGYLGKTNSVISRSFTQEDFTYTGSYVWVDDGNGNFRFKALTSGTFTPLKKIVIDVFIVGGGGGGRNAGANQYAGGGGAGGLTGTWTAVTINANQAYPIVIGAGGAANGGTGGTTSGFGYSKAGGAPGANYYRGGIGGSGGGGALDGGGAGGSNGSNGANATYGGAGQNSTTREFGEIAGTIYAGGGGSGGGKYSYYASGGLGGAGGGGNGGACAGGSGAAGTANTGGGGGGGGADDDSSVGSGAAGGSGILIIRNKR